MSDKKNDLAWEKIFNEHPILEKIEKYGCFEISATEINKFREARLMTKFDHKSQLPAIFETNKLSILPISRGAYKIGCFDTFCNFNKDEINIAPIKFPSYIESIDHNNITSESTAINCAFVTGILRNFLDEEEIFPTVSGRMGSSSFNFEISSLKGPFNVEVTNSQIEIDGGFEGAQSLSLIEAKNYLSDDFLIRQLYYPYRLWKNKVNKLVRPIFLTYSNGIFHLREYKFMIENFYNSITLVQHKKYAIQEDNITIETIQKLLNNISIKDKEPKLPFPQADSFERVINLCELLKERIYLSKEAITLNYDFTPRQTDYYSNAAMYLGLIDEFDEYGQKGFVLSKEGNRIFNLSIGKRQLEFVKLILSHKAFNRTLKLFFKKASLPTKIEVVQLMKESDLFNIRSQNTFERRSATIISWISWIINLTK